MRYLIWIDADRAIVVVDMKTGVELRRWRGAVVRYLLEVRVLPLALLRSGSCVCSKCAVWHLFLAATAARVALKNLDRMESSDTSSAALASWTTTRTHAVDELEDLAVRGWI